MDETRTYFFEETNQNDLMSKNHKKLCTDLNYIDYLLILASLVIVCVFAKKVLSDNEKTKKKHYKNALLTKLS